MWAFQQPVTNKLGVQHAISAGHHTQIQPAAPYVTSLPIRALPCCRCSPPLRSNNGAAATKQTPSTNSLHQNTSSHTDQQQTSSQSTLSPAQAAAALTRQIKQSEDWRQLAQLWQQWSTIVNAVHIAAMLVQAVKTAPQSGNLKDATDFTRSISEVVDAVPSRLEQCRAREVASIAWAAAKLGALCSDLHTQPSTHACMSQPSQQTTPHASSMQYTGYIEQASYTTSVAAVHGGSKARQFGMGGTLAISTEWWNAVMTRCLQLLPHFNGQDMSMMLWAVVALQGQQEAQQQQLQTSHKTRPSSKILPSQTMHDTSTSTGLVVSGQQQAIQKKSHRHHTTDVLPQDFLQEVLRLSETALPSYSAQALSGTVWALAKLRMLPSMSWQERFLDASCNQLQKAEPQGLANTAWALAVMEVEPTREWSSAFLTASAGCAGRLPPASASQILWAAARIPALQPTNKWVATICTAIQPQLGMCSTQDMANALWAVAHLGYKPSVAWMDATMQAVHAQLPTYQPLEMSAVLTAVAKLKYHPGDAAVNAMASQVIKSKPAAGLQSLVNSLWAMAKLGFRPQPSWMQGALSSIGRQLHDIGPQELATLWWSLPQLGCRPSQQMVSSLSEELMIQKTVMAPPEIAMLLTGYAKLGIYQEKEELDSLMSQLFRGMAAQPMASSQHTRKLQVTLPTDYSVPQTIVSVLQALARMAKNSRGEHGKSQAGSVWQLLTRCVVTAHPNIDNRKALPCTSSSMQPTKLAIRSRTLPSVPSPQLSTDWSALDIALVLQSLSYLEQPLPRAWGAAALLHVNSQSNAQQWRDGRAVVIAACAVARLHSSHSARIRIRSTAARRMRHPLGKASTGPGGRRIKVVFKHARKPGSAKSQHYTSPHQAPWVDGWVVALAKHLGSYRPDDWKRYSNSQLTQASTALMYLIQYSYKHGEHLSTGPAQQLLTAYHSLIQHALSRSVAGLLDSVQSTQLLTSTSTATRLAMKHNAQDLKQLQAVQTQLLATPSFIHVALETYGVRELCGVLAVAGRARMSVDPTWLHTACSCLQRRLRDEYKLPHDDLQASNQKITGLPAGGTAASEHHQDHHTRVISGPGWSASTPVPTSFPPRGQTTHLVAADHDIAGSYKPLARHPAALTANDCAAAVAGLRVLLNSCMVADHRNSIQVGTQPKDQYIDAQLVEQVMQDLGRLANILLEHKRHLRRQYLLRKLIR